MIRFGTARNSGAVRRNFRGIPAQPWRNFLTRASLSGSLRPSPGLAVDADDVLYVADSGNHCIRRVTPEGVVSTVAGTGDAGIDGSRLNSPCGVCVCCPPGLGPALLVADRQNSCVRTVAVDVLPPVRVVPSTLRADRAIASTNDHPITPRVPRDGDMAPPHPSCRASPGEVACRSRPNSKLS